MKYSKFLNKSFENKEDFERELDNKIQELFDEAISNYNILKTTIEISKEVGEEEIYIITDMEYLDESTVEESVENNSYYYCYNYALYELEQYVWESLYEFEENINEVWEKLKTIDV